MGFVRDPRNVNIKIDLSRAPDGLTHAGDPLSSQVLQQGFNNEAVPGVKLVAVDADVEAQPVGVRLLRHVSGGRELLLLLVGIVVVPEKHNSDRGVEQGVGRTSRFLIRLVIYRHN